MQLCCCISVINKSQRDFINKIKAWQFFETSSSCSFQQEQLLFCRESWISWCPGEFTWRQGVGVNFETKYDSYVEYDKGRNFRQMTSVTWCSDVFLICCFGQWGELGLGRHLFIVGCCFSKCVSITERKNLMSPPFSFNLSFETMNPSAVCYFSN